MREGGNEGRREGGNAGRRDGANEGRMRECNEGLAAGRRMAAKMNYTRAGQGGGDQPGIEEIRRGLVDQHWRVHAITARRTQTTEITNQRSKG